MTTTSKQPWSQLLLFPRQHEIQLCGDPVGGHGLAAPFMDTAGGLAHKTQMADGDEKLHGIKIRMQQFGVRPKTGNEAVPRCVLLLLGNKTTIGKKPEILSPR